jgi:palmitoyltransferase
MFGLRPPCSLNTLEDLAIPAVSFLIIFLAYTSQYLFYYTEPGPLTKSEAIWFNVLVLGIWWCYDHACFTDPGPKGWVDKAIRDEEDSEDEAEINVLKKGMRWCKKCDAVKPPRAHHCKKCGRYFPSSTTFSHCKSELC